MLGESPDSPPPSSSASSSVFLYRFEDHDVRCLLLYLCSEGSPEDRDEECVSIVDSCSCVEAVANSVFCDSGALQIMCLC